MIKLIDKVAIFIVALAMLVSCNVDSSYDLSNLESDNIGFGTDETSFSIPLFKVTFAIPESSSESVATKSSSFTFDVESITEAIEVGEDILEILERNLDGDKNTISLIANTATSLGERVEATPIVSFTDYNGEYREFEVGSAYVEGDEMGVITNIDTIRALLDSISITSSITIGNMNFSVEALDPEDRYIVMIFSAYKRGSLLL